MGSANLSVLKRRMKSIKNTMKITKAMGVISNSKLQRCKVRLYPNNEFFTEFKEIVTSMIKSAESDHQYIKGNSSDKTLYIVFTSDLGLCGGFNSNLLITLENRLDETGEDSPIVVCGQKGRDYLRRKKMNTIAEYIEIPDTPNIGEAKEIISKAIYMYSNNEIGKIKAIYYKYESQMSRVINVKTLLPLKLEENILDNAEEDEVGLSSIVEVSKEIDVKELVELYLSQYILNILINNKMSEHSYRLETTNNASKNGGDLLNKLNQKYNRARQSSITNEICEIVGGAEALK